MATFYVDSAADPGGDGTTQVTTGANCAFNTVAAAQAALTGDQHDNSLLFKRGCIWREQYSIPANGTIAGQFTIGKYGTTGADPIISAANLLTSWTPEVVGTDLSTDDNIQAFWMMEEESGTRADGTGHGNTLADNNTVTRSTEHEEGSYSASFASASTEYLSIADASLSAAYPLKDGVTTADITIGCWIRAATLQTQWLYSKGDGFTLRVNSDGSLQANATDAHGSHASYTGNYVTSADIWYHIAMRVSGSGDKSIAIFCNGARVDWGPPYNYFLTDAVMTSSADVVYIGRYSGGGYFDGQIDEFFVFDRALSDAEIASIYNNGLVGVSFTAYYATADVEPKQIFEDNARYTSVVGKTGLVASTFYWDSANTRTYVRTSGNNDPTGNYTMEAGQRDWAILSQNHAYITISSIQTEKANLDGIKLTNEVSGAIVTGVTSQYNFREGIYCETQTNGLVTLCTCLYNGANGIAIYKSPSLIVDQCITHHNAVYDDDLYSAGIKFNDYLKASTGMTAQKCKSYSNGVGKEPSTQGSGIWADTVGSGFIAKYNLVYSNNGNGVFSEQNTASILLYNISYSNGQFGISVSGDEEISDSNLVYGNTTYGNLYGLRLRGTGTAGLCINNVFKNNISIGNTSGIQLSARNGGENDGTNGSGNVFEYNCLGVEAEGFVEWGTGTTYDTYDDWETAYGGSTHSIEADPLFTNAAGGDFTLQATAPCIDAGVSLGTSYTNQIVSGSTWPSAVTTIDWHTTGGAPDIGAYDYRKVIW